MPDPIRCITCGAVSFASPKAALHCHTCYEKLCGLLQRAYVQQPGDHFRDDLPPDKMLRVWFTVAELREIAALFAEKDE